MLGSKSAQAIEDMVGYAQETQHEKILRGLAVGIALVMYGRMEEADALIESLCRDKVRLRQAMSTVTTQRTCSQNIGHLMHSEPMAMHHLLSHLSEKKCPHKFF